MKKKKQQKNVSKTDEIAKTRRQRKEKKPMKRFIFLVPFSHNVWLMCERNKLKRLTEVKSTLLKSYNSAEQTN